METTEQDVDFKDVPPDLEPPLRRLSKDLVAAADSLSGAEARYLVDLYYQVQGLRIAAGQQGAAQANGTQGPAEPNLFLNYTTDALAVVERNIVRAMNRYTEQQPVSRWAKSLTGIGPVLAAGLIAHIDPVKAPTAGHIWRFAGLDPTLKWGKGEKRPFNARLKVLCWKIGTSFWRFHNHPECVYGKVFKERKVIEIARNDSGACAEAAAQTLRDRKVVDKGLRATLESGRIPDGRVHLRAQRYAVKLFLSHWHHVARESMGLEVPKPYILTRPEHTHYLAPPNWPMIED